MEKIDIHGVWKGNDMFSYINLNSEGESPFRLVNLDGTPYEPFKTVKNNSQNIKRKI